jgi:integrase
MPETTKRRGGQRDGLFKKRGTWWLDYYDADGKRHREKAAPSYDVAKLMLRDKLNAIAKGEVTGIRAEGIRFADFVNKRYWPAVESTLAPVWAQRSRGMLDDLLDVFGDTKLAALRREEIERWFSDRLGRVKGSTANKDLTRLKHCLGRAVEWGYLRTSPATKVRKVKEPDGRTRFLTVEERDRLVNGTDETVKAKDGRAWTIRHQPNADLKLYIVAALQTGARRAELLRLRWSDVDMKRRKITFRQTKNGRDRTVPMTGTLHALLHDLPRPLDPTAPVLPSYAPMVLSRSFARHAKRVGLAGLRLHDLRHDAASTLTAAGVSQRAVMEILGHRDPRMTIRYQHVAPGHLEEAMRALDHAAQAPAAPLARLGTI